MLSTSLRQIFEGELFAIMLSTSLRQIFCKSMLDFKVICKSMTAADGTGHVELQVGMGEVLHAEGFGDTC